LIRHAALLCTLAICAGLQAQEQGRLDSSETLFSVMAAVNVGLPEPAPVVGEHLAGRKIDVLSELRNFVVSHHPPGTPVNWSPYISFALSSGGPPDFKPNFTGLEEPPDLFQLEGFRGLLIRFYREAALHELWTKLEPAYQREIDRYHEPVTRVLLEANAYLRNPTSGYMGRRFFVLVEMLAPPNQVHTRSYKDDYFIVITPAPQPRVEQVRHAYLHYLLDPLTSKFSESVMKKRSLGDFAQGAPALDESYKSDFLLLTTESLIRAIEARLDRKPAAVQESLMAGYILTPFFSEALPLYEKQETAMRMYFPDMMASMDVKKESKRLDAVDLTVAPPKPVTAAIERTPEPPREPAEKTLEEAEKLYEAHDFEKAGAAFQKALVQTEQKPLHARVYYGLARIAALNRDPQLAEQLFQKTLESSPDAHTRAWSEVYLGRLAQASTTPEEAVEHYRAALAVDGAPAKARQAAEEGLRKTSK
jgi:tetratricopeptide (TPR) repeat protein